VAFKKVSHYQIIKKSY